jgi:L-2-hydroxyglutarate oxidase LhgO
MVTNSQNQHGPRTVVIVGGGFSGALFGLKLHHAKPSWRIVIVERSRQVGRGIA